MKDSEIVILGAGGQLGLALQARFPGATALTSKELNIADPEAVYEYDWSGKRVIINAAAYTNVDGAETSEGRVAAWAINATAMQNLVLAAEQHDLILVHLSSDYVFDGNKKIHTEDEPYSPLGVYGQTKAAGDLIVGLTPKHYIIRTSWVIGDGKNFVRTMMSLAEKNISPTVVNDQIGRLSFTSTLADSIEHLLKTEAPNGTYNVSNDGKPSSWADITRKIFELLGRNDLNVSDTSTAEYFSGKAGIAPRPLQSTLSLDKIQSAGFIPSNWEEELKAYIDRERNS